MLRRNKRAVAASMTIERAQQDTQKSRTRAEADLAHAKSKAAEAELVLIELRNHNEHLEETISTLLGGGS